MRTLIGIGYSPWTQKARWALEHNQVAYRFKPYTPLISELGVRLKLRQMTGKFTVPMLFDEKETILDSQEIALHAESLGNAGLFDQREKVLEFDRLSNEGLEEGRLRVSRGVENNPAAQKEALIGLFPAALHGTFRGVARTAAARISKKYQDLGKPGALASALESTRQKLNESGGLYLLGSFSYADIAMSVMLDCVEPPSDAYVKRAPATRDVWRDHQLAEQYSDLITWRDELYEKHRRKRGESRKRAS